LDITLRKGGQKMKANVGFGTLGRLMGLSDDLIKKIQEEAEKKERSFTGQIRFIVKAWAEERKEKEEVDEK